MLNIYKNPEKAALWHVMMENLILCTLYISFPHVNLSFP